MNTRDTSRDARWPRSAPKSWTVVREPCGPPGGQRRLSRALASGGRGRCTAPPVFRIGVSPDRVSGGPNKDALGKATACMSICKQLPGSLAFMSRFPERTASPAAPTALCRQATAAGPDSRVLAGRGWRVHAAESLCPLGCAHGHAPRNRALEKEHSQTAGHNLTENAHGLLHFLFSL